MTLLQAILLAMLYWLAAGEIFVPFTYCFCDLMLISLLTGVILGGSGKGLYCWWNYSAAVSGTHCRWRRYASG